MADYQKAIIYKWICDDCDEVYVGSTTNFTRRKHGHKTACNNENDKQHHLKIYQTMREYGGFENWRMIQIESYPCQSKRELQAREEHWRKELNAKLNQLRAFVTAEERKEQLTTYREANRESRLEKQKEWNDKNSDLKKEWYQNNKERMQTLAKAKYERTKEVVKARSKARYEDKKEEIHAKQKLYNEKNKDKRIEYMKKYHEDHKEATNAKRAEKITCECGACIRISGLAKHLKTQKHIQLIEAQNKKQ